MKGGELAYATFLASNKAFPVYGGEPSNTAVITHLVNSGFTREDGFHSYLLRMFPQWSREKKFETKPWEAVYADFNQVMGKIFGYYGNIFGYSGNKRPDLDAFKAWYKTKNGKEFHPNQMDLEEIAPLVDGKYFTQQLCAKIDSFRDRSIVSAITERLNEDCNVLTVYGKGHFIAQQKVLEAMMGRPEFTVQ